MSGIFNIKMLNKHSRSVAKPLITVIISVSLTKLWSGEIIADHLLVLYY